MITTHLNTKFAEVQNKITDFNGLGNKTDSDTKIKNIEGKSFTTSDYNKLVSDIVYAVIKQKQKNGWWISYFWSCE